MSKAFGTKDLVRALQQLGFRYIRGSSSHDIYNPPSGKHNLQNRPLPLKVGVKSYDPHSRARYISEIKSYGFTKDEIKKAFEN